MGISGDVPLLLCDMFSCCAGLVSMQVSSYLAPLLHKDHLRFQIRIYHGFKSLLSLFLSGFAGVRRAIQYCV